MFPATMEVLEPNGLICINMLEIQSSQFTDLEQVGNIVFAGNWNIQVASSHGWKFIKR